MKKILLVIVIIIVILLLTLNFFPGNKMESEKRVGLDQCLIEKGELTCGRSYSVVNRGVVHDLIAYQPFDLSQFNPSPSILFLMDQALAEQISQFDNVPYAERQEDVDRITENYQKETGRKGSYAFSVSDGFHDIK